MAYITEAKILERIESNGVEETVKHFVTALQKGDLKPSDFSLKEMFLTTVTDKQGRPMGKQVLDEWGSGQGRLKENTADAVSLGNFSNISYQWGFSAVDQGYKRAEGKVADLFRKIPSQLIGPDGERIPSISNLSDAFGVIPEGEPYPKAKVGEDFVNTPSQNKLGMEVDVTKEAIIGDRTGQLQQHCEDLGAVLRRGENIEACDVIINANTSTARAPNTNGSTPYKWKGVNYGVWQTDATVAPFYANSVSSNPLKNPSSIENAWLSLVAIKDPNTSQSISHDENLTLLCGPQLKYKAMRILHGLQYRSTQTNDLIVSSPESVVDFNLVSDQVFAERLSNASAPNDNWYLCDFQRMFAFLEAWGILVEVAMPNSGSGFSRDLVFQIKASRKSTAAVMNPRYGIKNTA